MSGFDLTSLLKQLDDIIEREMEKLKINFDYFIIKPYGGSQRPDVTNKSRNLVVNDSGSNELSSKSNNLLLANKTSAFNSEGHPSWNGVLVPPCSSRMSENITGGVTLSGECIKKKSKAVDIIDPVTCEKIQF